MATTHWPCETYLSIVTMAHHLHTRSTQLGLEWVVPADATGMTRWMAIMSVGLTDGDAALRCVAVRRQGRLWLRNQMEHDAIYAGGIQRCCHRLVACSGDMMSGWALAATDVIRGLVHGVH